MPIHIRPILFRIAEIIVQKSGQPDAIAFLRSHLETLPQTVLDDAVDRAVIHTATDFVPLDALTDVLLDMDDGGADPERLEGMLEQVSGYLNADEAASKRLVTFIRFVQYVSGERAKAVSIQIQRKTSASAPSSRRDGNTLYLNEGACLRWGQMIVQTDFLSSFLAFLLGMDEERRTGAYTKLLERITMEKERPTLERFRTILGDIASPPPALPPHIPKNQLN